MSKNPRILIVIADGEHARLVRPRPDNVLRTERHFDSATAHKQSSDLGSDHPGASFHSDASAHHGLAPRHDLHGLEKEKFSRLVAQQLNEISGDSAFDALVIVAPADSGHLIRDGLDTETRAKIVGTLNKDLMKVPDDELWSHLQEWVPPAQPARQK